MSKQKGTKQFPLFGIWLISALIFAVALFVIVDSYSKPYEVGSLEPVVVVKEDSLSAEPFPVPSGFNPETSKYILAVASKEGMHHLIGKGGAFVISRPGNTLVAQLIKRDDSPIPLNSSSIKQGDFGDISIKYSFAPEYTFAKDGKMEGIFELSEDGKSFVAKDIPILPYLSDGKFMPYPVATVTAYDNSTGDILATTAVVVPVSNEIGCLNCHGGSWDQDGSGIGKETAQNILIVHDRRNGTNFMERVKLGDTIDCASCHDGSKQMNLSAAIHGFHATMDLKGDEACGKCHPSSATGKTRFQRDIHAMFDLSCTKCHGEMSDHALSLLKYEAEQNNKEAKTRMEQIKPISVSSVSDINPRKPYVNMPDCTGCHNFENHPDIDTANAFNKWTKDSSDLFSNRYEDSESLRCLTCHSSPHAVYPASNPYDEQRDNLQPLEYQKAAMPLGGGGNCSTCHIQKMEGIPPIHHPLPE